MPPPSSTPPPTQNPKHRTLTIRNPPHAYIRLSPYHREGSNRVYDYLTLRTFLTAHLDQFLGMTGTAIPIDILSLDPGTGEAVVRVPREDAAGVVGAVTTGTGAGWRVVGRGEWLGGMAVNGGGARGEEEVFVGLEG